MNLNVIKFLMDAIKIVQKPDFRYNRPIKASIPRKNE